jgi:hypothetical protein
MNDTPKDKPALSETAIKARLALEMKRKAAEDAKPAARGPQRRQEIDAAARAAAKSKSKPKKRK